MVLSLVFGWSGKTNILDLCILFKTLYNYSWYLLIYIPRYGQHTGGHYQFESSAFNKTVSEQTGWNVYSNTGYEHIYFIGSEELAFTYQMSLLLPTCNKNHTTSRENIKTPLQHSYQIPLEKVNTLKNL